MKEVKIEYNKILLPFCCGLTAFSNLLQPQFRTYHLRYQLRLDRIF